MIERAATARQAGLHVGSDAAAAARVLDAVDGYPATPREAVIAGSPGEVADTFRKLGEMGYDEVLVRHVAQDHSQVLGSFERLATVLENL